MKKLLGNTIKMLRGKKGLTQEQLSRISGVSQQHISRIENGHRLPRLDVFCDLANALGEDPGNILKQAGITPGSIAIGGEVESQLYQVALQLDDVEKRRVSDYAIWRLNEQKQRYELNQQSDEGGQEDGADSNHG